MMTEPVNLQKTLDSFTELWSPRIVAQFNDYDVRVAKFHGEYVWHAHQDTDELFLVVAGRLVIHLRENGVERFVTLQTGDTYVVPRGMEHKPVSDAESHILMVEPTGTLTVGDTHEEIPDHVDATTGHHIG
ncbi:cupin domain-containing protein [Streptomyces triticiradicis]|uniref:Cupin domain-containing protein n=1 Tax=Streptomyces triticiradicis TaxID=2651189 RepID=A0A7J5DJX7_9ACTN|nr:cupin domain-containing protein [Streptomyces triticiradicis]KAB1989009.1 cupin domain-containing protein [Streptomyces triticiradicis]